MSSGEIFDSVVREFNDYEEMIIILERDEIIKEQIADLDEKSKLILMKYAKNFELIPEGTDDQYIRKWVISAKWNDQKYMGQVYLLQKIYRKAQE